VTSRDDPRRLIAWGITMSLVGIVALGVLYLLRNVLLVLYVAMLLAIGFSPAVRWLERRRFTASRLRLPRWAAILLLYITGLGVVALVLVIVLPPFIRQVTQLWTALPGYIDRTQDALVQAGLITQRWTWSELLTRIESPGLALSGVVGAVQGVLGTIAMIATVLVLPFYLLVEAEMLQRGFLRLFAPERRSEVARLTRDVTLRVGAWLGGQLLLGAIIGGSAALGLWLLGVPYFYVLGLIAGLGEMIPVVGPIFAAIPALLVGWTVSTNTAIFVAAYFAVQQFIENNVLVPRIMERQVGVSASTVIIALLIGSELLGLVGALLAVPTAAIIQVLVQAWLDRSDA
jgi:predicted PurR-regulated permease PerM